VPGVKSRWAVIVIPCAVVVGIGLLWKLTPLANYIEPDRLAAEVERFSGSRAAPLSAALLFSLAAAAMVPLLLLITATALVFKPALAVPICLFGSMVSSAVLYATGAKFVRGHAHEAFGPTLEKVRNALHARGIIAIATIRMLPIAPFGLINVAAGSIGVRFRDFMFGTALGLAPGTIVLCLFGQQVKALWQNPTPSGVLIAMMLVAAWIALSLGLQRVLTRRKT
jgi:phospholipase D1/2